MASDGEQQHSLLLLTSLPPSTCDVGGLIFAGSHAVNIRKQSPNSKLKTDLCPSICCTEIKNRCKGLSGNDAATGIPIAFKPLGLMTSQVLKLVALDFLHRWMQLAITFPLKSSPGLILYQMPKGDAGTIFTSSFFM